MLHVGPRSPHRVHLASQPASPTPPQGGVGAGRAGARIHRAGGAFGADGLGHGQPHGRAPPPSASPSAAARCSSAAAVFAVRRLLQRPLWLIAAPLAPALPFVPVVVGRSSSAPGLRPSCRSSGSEPFASRALARPKPGPRAPVLARKRTSDKGRPTMYTTIFGRPVMGGALLTGSALAAFLAGMVAFFAPCCAFVMLPTYLASVTGASRWRTAALTGVFVVRRGHRRVATDGRRGRALTAHLRQPRDDVPHRRADDARGRRRHAARLDVASRPVGRRRATRRGSSAST